MSSVPAAVDVVTFGESLGSFNPTGVGPLGATRTLELRIGGAESNVAIGLARLGLRAAWFGAVGDDPLGDVVVETLLGQGVEVHARRVVGGRTGLMLREQRTPDVQRVAYYRAGSAGSTLSFDDLDPDVVGGARLLHVTGITPSLSASARDATRRAVAMAREAGVQVSFDLNYRSKLWSADDAASVYRELAPQCDLVLGGEDEIAILLGREGSREELLDGFEALGGRGRLIVKNGADGAYARVGGELVHVPARRVPVVDTVGAGDGFVAGFLAAHLRGADVTDALRSGVTAAAFVCMAPGDWEGAPRPADLALLDARDNVQR